MPEYNRIVLDTNCLLASLSIRLVNSENVKVAR